MYFFKLYFYSIINNTEEPMSNDEISKEVNYFVFKNG